MGTFVALLVPPPKVVALPAPVEPPQPPVDVPAVQAAARAEGREEALAEVAAELAQARAALGVLPDLLDAVAHARREALDHAALDVVDLLRAALRKVLGDHLVHRPEVLASIVNDALARIEDEESVEIRLPAAAAEFVAAQVPERFRAGVRGDADRIAGCVVETRHVTIDVSVETICAGFDDAMLAWLEGRS